MAVLASVGDTELLMATLEPQRPHDQESPAEALRRISNKLAELRSEWESLNGTKRRARDPNPRSHDNPRRPDQPCGRQNSL